MNIIAQDSATVRAVLITCLGCSAVVGALPAR
jgi:hypothetical protein